MKTDELVREMEDRAARGTPRDPVVVVGVASWNAAGRRRRSFALGAAAAALLVICGVAFGQAIAERDPSVRVVDPVDDSAGDEGVMPSDLPTLPMVEYNGIGLRVPDGWNTTGENLTPIVSPQVVAGFGTGPLVAGGGESCAQVPIQAILAMDDEDVFVSLIERFGAGRDWPSRRPSLWGMRGDANNSEAVTCSEWPSGFDAWWFQFEDGGRTFHVLAVVGPAVSDERRDLFEAAVDEIYVEPAIEYLDARVTVHPDAVPPYPMGMTGAIGHPVTVDGRPLLVGLRIVGAERCAELEDPKDGSSLGRFCVTNPGGSGTGASAGYALGFARPGVATVEHLGDDGETKQTEVFELDSEPGVPLWIAPIDGSTTLAERRIRYLDADGNRIDPSR